MRNAVDKLCKYLFILLSCISIISVILICIFLCSNGFPAIKEIGLWNFIFGTVWKPSSNIYGIFPMIIGSLIVTIGAGIIGIPIGILTAICLSQFVNKRISQKLMPVIQVLAGIPSVVYGFFGIVVIVPFIRDHFDGNGLNAVSASLLLGIMILPTIINVSKASIDAVLPSYLEGSIALGISKEVSVFKVVVPAAKKGIISGIVLGVGRAIGETMAVIMVAGNQPRIPDSLFKGIRTLTVNIAMEMGYAADLHRQALIATAVVLFVFILIVNVCLYTFNGDKHEK